MTATLPIVDAPSAHPSPSRVPSVVLVGNPNVGKTSLYNVLAGLRAHTANYPGTTVAFRSASIAVADQPVKLIDLPGVYDLEAQSPEAQVARTAITGGQNSRPKPDAVLLVLDAAHLERNLFFANQVLPFCDRAVVALNMIDVAEQQGTHIDTERLSQRLGHPVVAVSAATGRNIDQLQEVLASALQGEPAAASSETATCTSCTTCPYTQGYSWAGSIARETVERRFVRTPSRLAQAIDALLTQKVTGTICFFLVMLAIFWLIFSVAAYPMDWIDALFASTGSIIRQWVPEGDLRSLLSDGIVGGVGGILIFLPQICVLFFVLSLLDDSGYLARAVLVMDKLMHRVGLPGQAFVPLVSAHACAIPAIMASRVISDRRDRLATILVAPLMSCSARVPVYAMVVALLFPHQPLLAALLFSGAYALGIVTALVMAWIFKLTILPGRTQPLIIELPPMRRPSLRNALLLTYDRAKAFVVNAGTVILVISLVLWALATYPKISEEEISDQRRIEIESLEAAGDEEAIGVLLEQAQLEYSLAGRLGKLVQPVFAPLGFDWKISIGVVTSFAAREVVVSSLAILYGMNEDEASDNSESLYANLKSARLSDGTPVFTVPTCLSLLVFYVLAMQCLPTQAVTYRETGSWAWPLLQLSYMTALAYVGALTAYTVAAAFV